MDSVKPDNVVDLDDWRPFHRLMWVCRCADWDDQSNPVGRRFELRGDGSVLCADCGTLQNNIACFEPNKGIGDGDKA